MTDERKARCRYHKRNGNPCPNEVIDPDPSAIQICPSHALRAAQLLADAGAIRMKPVPINGRKTA